MFSPDTTPLPTDRPFFSLLGAGNGSTCLPRGATPPPVAPDESSNPAPARQAPFPTIPQMMDDRRRDALFSRIMAVADNAILLMLAAVMTSAAMVGVILCLGAISGALGDLASVAVQHGDPLFFIRQ